MDDQIVEVGERTDVSQEFQLIETHTCATESTLHHKILVWGAKDQPAGNLVNDVSRFLVDIRRLPLKPAMRSWAPNELLNHDELIEPVHPGHNELDQPFHFRLKRWGTGGTETWACLKTLWSVQVTRGKSFSKIFRQEREAREGRGRKGSEERLMPMVMAPIRNGWKGG